MQKKKKRAGIVSDFSEQRHLHLKIWWDLTWQTLKVYLETIVLRHICFHLPTALINGEVGLNKRSVLDRSLHLLLHITRTFVLPHRAFFLLHHIISFSKLHNVSHWVLQTGWSSVFFLNYFDFFFFKFSACAVHSGSISHIWKNTWRSKFHGLSRKLASQAKKLDITPYWVAMLDSFMTSLGLLKTKGKMCYTVKRA